MLSGKPVELKRKQIGGIGIVLFFIVVCIQQHTSVIAQTAGSPNDILIIVNRNADVGSASLTVIRDLFLKVRKAWGNGSRAMPINTSNEQLRDDFRKRVLNMDAMAEERYWEDFKVKFGQKEPPSFSNSLKAVFKLSDSVSYVYRKDYRSNVAKVVLVVPSNGD